MAFCRCHHHRPEGPHHLTYTQPLTYLELLCSEAGCTQPASIWLNPEEVKDYERGSRLFYNETYDVFKVDSRGLNTIGPNLLRWLRISFQPQRKAQNIKPGSKTQKKFET